MRSGACRCRRHPRLSGEQCTQRGKFTTRSLVNAAVLDEVHIPDGHVVDAAYKKPFDLLFSSPKFEPGDLVGAGGYNANPLVDGTLITL